MMEKWDEATPRISVSDFIHLVIYFYSFYGTGGGVAEH